MEFAITVAIGHAGGSTGHKTNRKIFLAAIAIAALITQKSAWGITFHEAVQLARESPQVTAAQRVAEASREGVQSADALPDPRLIAGVENVPVQGTDRYTLGRDFMTMTKVGLMQEFPNASKRKARAVMAQAQFARDRMGSELTLLYAQKEAAFAWIRRYTLEQQLATLAQLRKENQLFTQAIAALIASNKARAPDSILPRLEAAALDEREDELSSARTKAIAELVRWVGEKGQMALEGAPPVWNLSPETMRGQIHQHPELASYQARMQLAEAQIAEAKADQYPDWSVEMAYQRRGPQYADMASLVFTLSLPLFSSTRQLPRIAAGRANLASLSAEQDAAIREHRQMIDSDLADYQRLEKAWLRNREVQHPLAQERIELALAEYQSGRSSLTEVLKARQELLEVTLKGQALAGARAEVGARLFYASLQPRGDYE